MILQGALAVQGASVAPLEEKDVADLHSGGGGGLQTPFLTEPPPKLTAGGDPDKNIKRKKR